MEVHKFNNQNDLEKWIEKILKESEANISKELKQIYEEINFYQEQIRILLKDNPIDNVPDDNPLEEELLSERAYLEELKKKYNNLIKRK